MPLIEVDEPHARPPRVAAVKPGAGWQGPLVLDRGWAELASVELDRSTPVDLTGCVELAVADSRLDGVAIEADDGLSVEVQRSHLQACDLSRVRIRSLRATRVEAVAWSLSISSQRWPLAWPWPPDSTSSGRRPTTTEPGGSLAVRIGRAGPDRRPGRPGRHRWHRARS